MLTASIPIITAREDKVPNPIFSKNECASILIPTKLKRTPKPIGKNLNNPIKFERKKNKDRKPITAKTLEKNTI